ncbi:TetR/AcrR family transcriptional regulator [Streptomyces clavuligerus]|uniref:Transcriptional regulator, TetR family n=1 Tax=Streptomyces clavuligerus TaxID=1901 RepID=E2Q0D6_STRCL|nr:TetR/AcrR family transcriptional regulator [Streptomyces clavuligerus]ANW16993.1 transcriptional regulator [Streptomyces clavuligerus]AXU11523.1 TetR/AcrR family transcriptional regulator [Streptomyces clavuligerus]EFG10479.1 Transcriptional regulator, TetR family [Streptomyces clavuligerus]MBY6301343.1 TetR/AcrR family transcriptional regulator [Streptomyces clavuligerus]QCS04395.1 TetR/AcrR family transcriptional regulator [Streptomyces clavuligerus]
MSEKPLPARERILGAALRLFYKEGVRAVGVDRLIAESGVTKATFYRHFPSKEELVVAYVQSVDRDARNLIDSARARLSAAAAIEEFFSGPGGLGDKLCRPGFRGCPFLNVAAEHPDPESPVSRAIRSHMDWLHDRLRALLQEAGHPAPGPAADRLMLLRHGGMTQVQFMDPVHARGVLESAVREVLAQV